MNKRTIATLSLLAMAIAAIAGSQHQTADSLLTEDTTQQQRTDERNVSCFNLYIYQDRSISERLGNCWTQQMEALEANNRGLLGDVFQTVLGGPTSIMSLVSNGIDAAAKLVKGKKEQWMQLMNGENRFEKTLTTLQNIDDFYEAPSMVSALDPSNIVFNGFGCRQTRGRDTVLSLSCHLDTTQQAFSRILRHSKFQLRVDTLIFNPYLCDLPNDTSVYYSDRQPFSFEQRSNLRLNITASVTSSWVNQAIQVHRDQLLGTFTLKVTVKEEDLKDGVFRFIRGRSDNSVSELQVIGECFIVPRSYIGVRDNEGNYYDAWGTGEYKVEMGIEESCDIAPAMFDGNRWKQDWKRRLERENWVGKSCDMIRTTIQEWDEKASQWVVAVREIPSVTLENIRKQLNNHLQIQDYQKTPEHHIQIQHRK